MVGAAAAGGKGGLYTQPSSHACANEILPMCLPFIQFSIPAAQGLGTPGLEDGALLMGIVED